MQDKDLMSDSELAELESVLGGLRLRPSAKTQGHLMYECGRASEATKASASARTSWLRVAAMVMAVGCGVVAGRWTVGDVRTPGETISVAARSKTATAVKQSHGFDVANSFLTFSEKGSRQSSAIYAGMTLVRLEASLEKGVAQTPKIEDQPLQDATTVLSAGPFVNPMNQIEI